MNRRDFLSATAAACLLPALPAIPDLRPVLIWYDPFYYEFIAARSLEEARACLVAEAGYTPDAAAKWDGYAIDATAHQYRRDDGSTATMADHLAEELAAGQQVPYFFACEW